TLAGVPAGSNLGCNPAAAGLPTDASVKAVVNGVDGCGGVVTVNVSHTDTASGCQTTRTFTISATDACGNISLPVTVAFQWTTDTVLPRLAGVSTGSNLGCNPAAA